MKGDAMFDFEIRLHLCLHCGAPLEVPVLGGAVTCGYCDASMTVTPRAIAARVLAHPASADDPGERPRIANLWQQWRAYDDSKNRYSLDYAPDGIEIDGFDVSKKTGSFLEKELRRLAQLPQKHHTADHDRRLFWVTQRLANFWSMTGEPVRKHATLETASERLKDPGFRQIAYQDLARSALSSRNEQAGHSWLAQCDLTPRELAIDTGLRLTLGRLHHLRRDWPTVLDVIGHNAYQIPIKPSAMPTVSLMRAGTLDAFGLAAAAETELMGAIRIVAESTMDGNAEHSYGELKDEVQRRAVMWVANSLDYKSSNGRHTVYENCLEVWERLQERGHLPSQQSAAADFRRENG